MADFDTALISGKLYESIVLARIKSKYPSAHIMDGNFKDYDIFIPEIDFSIEVKADFKSNYTGNFVIEVEFNGKLSALSTTKANVWVLLDYDFMYWFYPINIYRCIEQNGFKRVSFTGNGDTVPKKAYLIPCYLLNKYAHKKLKYTDEEIKLLPIKNNQKP